jgi:hypothetical protein
MDILRQCPVHRYFCDEKNVTKVIQWTPVNLSLAIGPR